MTVLPFKKLEKIVNQNMLAWFSPLGFVKASAGGVERWEGDRYDYLACVVNRIGGENRVNPFGQMGFGHSQRIWSYFMSDDPAESNKIAVDVQLRYAHFIKNWAVDMLCQHEEDLENFLAQLRQFFFNELYPLQMSYTTPEKVLALYLKKKLGSTDFDPPSWFGFSSALTGLILARLHGPEHYPELKRRYAGEFADLDADTLARANRLIAYLDQPDPLPDLPSS